MRGVDPSVAAEFHNRGYDLTGCHEFEREDICMDVDYHLFRVFALGTRDRSRIDEVEAIMRDLWNLQCDYCGGVYFRELPVLQALVCSIDPNTFEPYTEPHSTIYCVRYRIKGKMAQIDDLYPFMRSPYLKAEGNLLHMLA